MSDWLPLREIDSLYDACNATRAVADNALAAEEAARSQAARRRSGIGSTRTGARVRGRRRGQRLVERRGRASWRREGHPVARRARTCFTAPRRQAARRTC